MDKQLFSWLTVSVCSFLWVLHQETVYVVDNAFNKILPPTQDSISYATSASISAAPQAISKIRKQWHSRRMYFWLPHPAERVPTIHVPMVTRLHQRKQRSALRRCSPTKQPLMDSVVPQMLLLASQVLADCLSLIVRQINIQHYQLQI